MRMKLMAGFVACLGLISQSALAAWHQGKVTTIGFGYDGTTVVFAISDWTKSNCTCYAPSVGNMCLNRARTSFKEEYAMLLAARNDGHEVFVNIDETTCTVEAMYETD